MWIVEQEITENEVMEQAVQAWPHVPSYFERFRNAKSAEEWSDGAPVRVFCAGCGFPEEAFHQCPQEAA